MKKKILSFSLVMLTVLSSTVYAASTSGVFRFKEHQANGYLNTKNWTTAEASTVLVSGDASRSMYVAVYANSESGERLATKTDRRCNKAYARAYAIGTQYDPLYVWQSQHSITGPDGYRYLTLYS